MLRRLKLGQMLDTLPERLTLARQGHLPHADFLEMVLTDEITRRDRASASVRARAAHLDPTMVAEAWDDTAKVSFDKAMWAELTTLRFVEDGPTPWSSARSGWARRSWPPPSATSPAGGASRCTSSGPTACTAD